MNASGVLLIILAVWVGAQVIKGGALERLGIIKGGQQ